MKNLLIISLLLITLVGCTSKKATHKDESISYAQGFTIQDEEGYKILTILDPWKPGNILQRYYLVPKDSELPKNLPTGVVVRVPLSNSVVYSSVHGGAIEELGSVDAIKGICDASYFNIKTISDRLKKGQVKDMGSSMTPSIEKIIELQPDAILLSPFQNAGHGVLGTIGVPIIECADYMESTPLGRAEWIKVLGLLYGKEEQADSIFKAVETDYLNLKSKTDSLSHKPIVITETVTNGVWYVPGGESYMAHLLSDAGADYPWKDTTSSGSLSLDFTQVLDKAQNADYWLVKTFGSDMTKKGLLDLYPLNNRFVAFNNGGVYACNTSATTLFADFPFHPDILLKEYINIFHPNILDDSQIKYFKQVKE